MASLQETYNAHVLGLCKLEFSQAHFRKALSEKNVN